MKVCFSDAEWKRVKILRNKFHESGLERTPDEVGKMVLFTHEQLPIHVYRLLGHMILDFAFGLQCLNDYEPGNDWLDGFEEQAF